MLLGICSLTQFTGLTSRCYTHYSSIMQQNIPFSDARTQEGAYPIPSLPSLQYAKLQNYTTHMSASPQRTSWLRSKSRSRSGRFIFKREGGPSPPAGDRQSSGPICALLALLMRRRRWGRTKTRSRVGTIASSPYRRRRVVNYSTVARSVVSPETRETIMGQSGGTVTCYSISHNSFGDRSFSAAGPRVLNVLPPELRHDISFGLLGANWSRICLSRALNHGALWHIVFLRLRNILTYLLIYLLPLFLSFSLYSPNNIDSGQRDRIHIRHLLEKLYR